MKTTKIFAVAGLTILLSGTGFAQSSVVISSPAQRVLQLSQAKVGDSTIVAYIQANPGDYQLTASGIIYLKQQGMSDQVITAMLNQHSATQTQTADTTAPVQSALTYSQPAPTAVSQPAPAVVYSQPPPTVVYASPTPVYYPSYSYPPVFPISLSFGWYSGGSYGGSYYHGGSCYYTGGYHGGGGYHH